MFVSVQKHAFPSAILVSLHNQKKIMKTTYLAAALLVLSTSAMAQNVGVSVTVGEPGFYGRIDLGNFGPPPVVYQQPVIIERSTRYVQAAPLYLRVPPGHEKHWDKHCREYNACGQRVYFVKDDWYTREYAPRYREQHGRGNQGYREDDRGHGRDRDDRDDGPGNGHGKGHGKGHDKHGD